MKKITFKKGIQQINIPFLPDINGELDGRMRSAYLNRPKGTKEIVVKKTVNLHPKLGYTMCEVTYSK